MEIEKSYFRVPEMLDRWEITERDLAYLAENGLLCVSVRVFNVPIEFGWYEEVEPGRHCSIPEAQRLFSGVLDLFPADVFALFRDQVIYPNHFQVPPPGYACLFESERAPEVRKQDLVVRREERDRFEADQAKVNGGGTSAAGTFFASPDYQNVRCNGHTFRLGAIQAEVVRLLHEAALLGVPWQNGKVLLEKANSQSLRMSDVFKSKAHWRQLIESNGRGAYRLAIV